MSKNTYITKYSENKTKGNVICEDCDNCDNKYKLNLSAESLLEKEE